MKFSFRPLLAGTVFFMLLTAMRPTANGPETNGLQVEIVQKEGQRLHLSGQNLTGKTMRIQLIFREKAAFGYATETLVYDQQQAADKPQLDRMLNLSQLQTGMYEVEIRAGRQRVARRLEIRALPDAPAEPQRTIALQ